MSPSTTPSMQHGQSPRTARELARSIPYSSVQEERAAIEYVDGQARAAYQNHERTLAAEVTERTQTARDYLKIADELDAAMNHEVRATLDRGMARADQNMAARYQELSTDFDTMIADLEFQAAFCETVAARVEDPVEDLERLLARFPSLKPLIY